ncbi:MAG TPA: glycosyltransferase family 87 protein [Caulobacteraceae bacterium]|jgi:hypothetical protein
MTEAARPPSSRPGPSGVAWALFAAASLALGAWPLIVHSQMKDYPTWYLVGRAVLDGAPIYPDAGHAPLRFIYPPFAALMLAPFSLGGLRAMILALAAITAVSWLIAVRLCSRLAGLPPPRSWWLLALPSVLVLPEIFDLFDLGQPNMMLLAMVLGGLALLQQRREWSAGTLFGVATALKAFPATILFYLLWRRRWRAAAAMSALTALCLMLAPAPFRGLDRNLGELRLWAQSMAPTAGGFGQRAAQNWGWKNQSLIAVTHRIVRPVNAEAEAPAVAPLTLNVLNLSYAQANLVVLALALALGGAFALLLPAEARRTPASDGAEYALLIAMVTIASPEARSYYFVWLLFPFAVLTLHAALDPSARVRRGLWAAIGLAAALSAVGAPLGPPHLPQALGNMFWAGLVVIGALGWLMRRTAQPNSSLTDSPS